MNTVKRDLLTLVTIGLYYLGEYFCWGLIGNFLVVVTLLVLAMLWVSTFVTWVSKKGEM